MIEIKYNRSENDRPGKLIPLGLPKNIRQIGQPGQYKKIYLEDYVYTYLCKLAKPTALREGMEMGKGTKPSAILFGEYQQVGETTIVYISGAIAIDDFAECQSDSFMQDVKQYFPHLEMVGWFLSRTGYSTELGRDMIEEHLTYFPDNNRMLFVMDALEEEDVFYLYENGSLNRQRGYYIYFAKNTAMQSFMIEHPVWGIKEEEREQPVVKKDLSIVENYRSKIQNKKEAVENQKNRMFYLASTLCTAVIVMFGLTIFNNYTKMKQLEESISRVSVSLENQMIENKLQKEKTTTEETTEETVETMGELPETYIVEEGDTLIAISKKLYHSTKYVSKLIEANHISDVKMLQPGMKLIVPKK
ncbi:MAG: LysM peptidoglycan-binding domain-containing protein [Lachnospiraceae bacterium]